MLDALANVRSSHTWEVLIVDNASTDDTARVLAAADDCGGRLKTAYCDRIGLGAARDFAWRQTSGSIIAFTDDDCYVAPDFVDAMIGAFREHPAVGAIGGRVLLFDPTDYPVTIDLREVAEEQAPYSFVPAGALLGANMAFRRTAMEAIGGIDPDLGAGTPYPCEDIDAVAGVAWAGMRSRYDPAPLVYHHHGRKEADLPSLQLSYDLGRGAYFTKYLLRKDSRWTYLIGWLEFAFHDLHRGSVRRLVNELRSARSYLRHRRRFGFLMVLAPVGWVVVLLMVAALPLQKLAKLARII